MLKDVIVSHFVHMLLSEESLFRRNGAFILGRFAQYGQHELAFKSFSISDSFVEDMRASMPKNAIVPQLVDMLSSENNDVKRSGAGALSEFSQYGEHELPWKSFTISDSLAEDMRASMPKDIIVPLLVDMLSSENSKVKRSGAETLSEFAQYGQHRLAWKSFSISHNFVENMRALMRKDVIVSHFVHMLSSEKSLVQQCGAFTLGKFGQYGEHELA